MIFYFQFWVNLGRRKRVGSAAKQASLPPPGPEVSVEKTGNTWTRKVKPHIKRISVMEADSHSQW